MFKMEVKPLPDCRFIMFVACTLSEKSVEIRSHWKKTFVTTFTVRIRLFCTILLLSIVKEHLDMPIQL